MKLKLLTLLLFFTFNSSSTFAVIDVKDNAQTKRTHNFQKSESSDFVIYFDGKRKLRIQSKRIILNLHLMPFGVCL